MSRSRAATSVATNATILLALKSASARTRAPWLLFPWMAAEAMFADSSCCANRLAQQLESANIASAAIHGNKSQGARVRALADFKANKIVALVATEVAARDLDIKELPHVVNYELPNVPEDYVHRIGRTARAGGTGAAVSLVSPDENGLLKDIERLLRKQIPVSQLPQF